MSTPLKQTDILADLKDIHTGTELDFGLAWGWWLVLLLVVLTLLGLYLWQKKAHKHRLNKKYIKQELLELQQSDNTNKVVEVSILLRRYANYQFAQMGVNSLSTQDWVSFLNEKISLDKVLQTAFLQDAYQKTSSVDQTVLFDYAHRWLDV